MAVTARFALKQLRDTSEQIRTILKLSTDTNRLLNYLGTIAPDYCLDEYDYSSLYDEPYVKSVITIFINNYAYINDCACQNSDMINLYNYIVHLRDNNLYILGKHNQRRYYSELHVLDGYQLMLYLYVLPRFFSSLGAEWFHLQ